MIGSYVNRAHDDYLELWLEAGVVGATFGAIGLIWIGRNAISPWRRADAGSADNLLARAATISIALLLLHSFVDYPLRTSAMLAFFAVACALLTKAPMGAGGALVEDRRREHSGDRSAHRRRRRAPQEQPA